MLTANSMKLSEKSKQSTREEWRHLFFFIKALTWKIWQLTGSKNRPGQLAIRLREYCDRAANQQLGEHEHLGPNCCFTFTTSETTSLGRHTIYGTLKDFRRLADVVENSLAAANVGDTVIVGEQYVIDAECELSLAVMADDFDPSSIDSQLK